eukprot:scaffold1260_cov343-Prasinococcus_capsulatus_cf.AAC.1
MEVLSGQLTLPYCHRQVNCLPPAVLQRAGPRPPYAPGAAKPRRRRRRNASCRGSAAAGWERARMSTARPSTPAKSGTGARASPCEAASGRPPRELPPAGAHGSQMGRALGRGSQSVYGGWRAADSTLAGAS